MGIVEIIVIALATVFVLAVAGVSVYKMLTGKGGCSDCSGCNGCSGRSGQCSSCPSGRNTDEKK